MANESCKCGCGNPLSEKNKNGYFRGHTPTGLVTTKKKPPTGLALAPTAEVELEYEAPRVAVEMNEQQLDRIYSMFPIEEKALGVLTALTADRS